MWDLIKFELQKIFGKKLVWACLLGMALMQCVMTVNWIYPGAQAVQYFQDGRLMVLEGAEAIAADQAIAEKYEGPLTDGKVQEILAEYDMPDEDMRGHQLDPGMEGYYSHNALYSSMDLFYGADGSWNGVAVEEAYGELADNLVIGYSSGWIDLIYAAVYTLMSLCCVLTIILAPLFAEEYTRGMDALILTGAQGRTKCVWAKIIVGFLVSAGLTAVCILLFLAVYLPVHGTQGWNASIQINHMGLFGDVPYPMTCGQGLLFALLLWFTASLALAAVSIFISAVAKSAFSSLVISFTLFTVPLFIPWNTLGALKLPALFFPIRQIQLGDMFGMPTLQIGGLQLKLMWLTVPLALTAVVLGSLGAKRAFSRHQVTG